MKTLKDIEVTSTLIKDEHRTWWCKQEDENRNDDLLSDRTWWLRNMSDKDIT